MEQYTRRINVHSSVCCQQLVSVPCCSSSDSGASHPAIGPRRVPSLQNRPLLTGVVGFILMLAFRSSSHLRKTWCKSGQK